MNGYNPFQYQSPYAQQQQAPMGVTGAAPGRGSPGILQGLAGMRANMGGQQQRPDLSALAQMIAESRRQKQGVQAIQGNAAQGGGDDDDGGGLLSTLLGAIF